MAQARRSFPFDSRKKIVADETTWLLAASIQDDIS
jgi:hypothetical protein